MNLSSNRLAWLTFACGWLWMFCGCSDRGNQAALELARQSVQTSLDTWKRGEQAATLLSGPNPIEFHDDHWKRSARLVDYEVIKTYQETDGTARCTVGLTVQYASKPPERIQVTYQVVNKERNTVIAIDPFS